MIREIVSFLLEYYNLFGGSMDIDFTALTIVFVVTFSVITLTFFLLKAFGLYALSKRNGIDKAYLSFIPFVSYYQLGRLVGPMSVFRIRVKNLGIIVGALLFASTVISNVVEYFRYFETLESILNANSFIPVLDAKNYVVYNTYTVTEILYYFNVVISIVETILYIFLIIAFFRFYSPRNAVLYSVLSVLFDPLFGAFVFSVRNKKKGEYYKRVYFDPYGGYFGNRPFDRDGNGGTNTRDFSATKNDDPFEEYKRSEGDVFEEYSDGKTNYNGEYTNSNNNSAYDRPTDNGNDDGDDLF